ncbi:MAG: hypothetical protein PVSMB1_18440 [Gemmatimonadaceae bacterium]
MSGFTRFPTRFLVLATTIMSLTALALALAPSVLASSSRSGALHITKECSQYTGLADSFCTITSSNLSSVSVGSRVVYFQAADATNALNSDIALVVGPGNLARGHVDLPATGSGAVTLSGGTGKFAKFHARVVVTCDATGIFCNWDGTYRFGQGD